jgi:hypothetical protein
MEKKISVGLILPRCSYTEGSPKLAECFYYLTIKCHSFNYINLVTHAVLKNEAVEKITFDRDYVSDLA